ncbi:hypothetical protein HK099_008651 [Clydaea vesicula]|uniref:Uncharacterized protein n=1 Tax=Clydaea vesicula TaxID=447962 RepID=A0AAD5TV80_9FUNG|nr:hypothetical protein HK099_008651 [Clydaea vesicula]
MGYIVGYFNLEETSRRHNKNIYRRIPTLSNDEYCQQIKTATLTQSEVSNNPSDQNEFLSFQQDLNLSCTSKSFSQSTLEEEDGLKTNLLNEDSGSLVEIFDDHENEVCVEHFSDFKNEEKSAVKDSEIISRNSIKCITGYGLLSLFNIIFDEIFALYMVAPSHDGGLEYASNDIGMCLSIMGIITLTTQLIIFPWLYNKTDALFIYRSAIPIYMIIFIIFPLISTFIATNSNLKFLTWPLLILNMSCRHFCNVMCFTTVMIMINNSSTREQLGFVNGVGQTTAALVRAIGPAFGGILWSWSLTNKLNFPFNYFFIFILLAILSSFAFIQSFFIPAECKHIMDDLIGEDDDNFLEQNLHMA